MSLTLRKKIDLMDEARIGRTLARMAHEVAERHPDLGRVAIVGIRSRGVPLARRLARALHEATGSSVPVGALDISLYRDDFTSIAAQALARGTEIPFSIDGRVVILVDDVLFTGRTVRAALDQLIDFGRPSRIELAVLMDRGHRELPIRADYVGKTLTTRRDEVVEVRLREEDGRDAVELMERVVAESPAKRTEAKGTVRKKAASQGKAARPLPKGRTAKKGAKR